MTKKSESKSGLVSATEDAPSGRLSTASSQAPVTSAAITLSQLQATNHARKERWHDGGAREWSVLEWAGAMCGESGEAANVAKKLLRIELGLGGNVASEYVFTDRAVLLEKLAGGIGDVVLYASLLADTSGIDFESAVRDSFNKKSIQLGFPERL